MGDGSGAHALLGHPIVLSEEDRGLVILQNLTDTADTEVLEEYGAWTMAALLSADIAAGDSFENIFSRLKKRMEKITGTISWALKIVKKMFPEEADGELSTEEVVDTPLKEMLSSLSKIYGGSNEALFQNKEKSRQKILMSLKNKFSSMVAEELLSLSSRLKVQTGDDMFDLGLGSAREILSNILRDRHDNLGNVLNYLNADRQES